MDEKSYENILSCNISYKTLIDAKPLHVRFNKTDGFIRVYDGKRYLLLFGSGEYDSIYNRIRYLISIKRGITYVVSQNYATVKSHIVDLYNSLPLEKTILFHNVVIFIKSVFNKDRNDYYYNIFLEKTSYELPEK